MLGKTEGRRRKGATEDEMVGWHHRFNEHELGQIPGDGERQGGLVCCGPWDLEESDTNSQLNNIVTEGDLKTKPRMHTYPSTQERKPAAVNKGMPGFFSGD